MLYLQEVCLVGVDYEPLEAEWLALGHLLFEQGSGFGSARNPRWLRSPEPSFLSGKLECIPPEKQFRLQVGRQFRIRALLSHGVTVTGIAEVCSLKQDFRTDGRQELAPDWPEVRFRILDARCVQELRTVTIG